MRKKIRIYNVSLLCIAEALGVQAKFLKQLTLKRLSRVLKSENNDEERFQKVSQIREKLKEIFPNCITGKETKFSIELDYPEEYIRQAFIIALWEILKENFMDKLKTIETNIQRRKRSIKKEKENISKPEKTKENVDTKQGGSVEVNETVEQMSISEPGNPKNIKDALKALIARNDITLVVHYIIVPKLGRYISEIEILQPIMKDKYRKIGFLFFNKGMSGKYHKVSEHREYPLDFHVMIIDSFKADITTIYKHPEILDLLKELYDKFGRCTIDVFEYKKYE